MNLPEHLWLLATVPGAVLWLIILLLPWRPWSTRERLESGPSIEPVDLSGITVLRRGFVPVRVEEHRERLLAIRDGQTPWDQVNAWRQELHKQFDAAFQTTRLPDRPDYEAANALLVKARRSMAK